MSRSIPSAPSPGNGHPIELARLVVHVAETLKRIDSDGPRGGHGRFKPGVGPLTEADLIAMILKRLSSERHDFAGAAPRRYPTGRSECDIVVPGKWAIEVKLARPFGDNGKPAERWSENLLYPYPGNTSLIGDSLKLIASGFREQKAVMAIGYEHTPPRIPLEPAIRSFELIARNVAGIELGPRHTATVTDLVHPYHQQAAVVAWEVLGIRG